MAFGESSAVVRRFVEEFWNQGNTAAADELMTADATIVLPSQGQVNREILKGFAMLLRSAFPDWHATVEELIVEDSHIAERWTGRGTHQGMFQGIMPTGRQVAVPGFVFYRVESGKIVEFRGLFDGLGLLQQLGALPSSEHAGAS